MQEEPVYRENVDTLQSSSYPPHPSAYPPHSPTYPPSPPAYPPHPPTYPPHPPTYPSYSHSPSYPVQNKPIYPSYADHHSTGYSHNKESEHVYHPTHPQPVLPSPPPSSLHTPGPGEDIGGNTQGFTNIFATVPRGKNIKQLFHQTLNVIILFFCIILALNTFIIQTPARFLSKHDFYLKNKKYFYILYVTKGLFPDQFGSVRVCPKVVKDD